MVGAAHWAVRTIAVAIALAAIACARMGAPPGGPEDRVAPVLLGTIPESLGVYPDWRRDVEFRFDEVISEGGSPNEGLGTGDLERLILLSPSSGVPGVSWKRDRITVHPREGWKRNRVYRIELLPGISDLRRNRVDSATVVTFSTGGELPRDTLRGVLIDWVQGKVAVGGLVELVLQPDSLVYRTLADSSGRFSIGPLPHGDYLVYAGVDQNHNLQRERRENYDSVLVSATAGGAVPPLWLIPRDTLGPRILSITPSDSVSAIVSFSQPLDPNQRFDSTAATLRRQTDSSIVPIRALLPKPVDDTLRQRERAQADSLRAAADTTPRDTTKQRPKAPLPSRPPPGLREVVPDRMVDSLLKTRPGLFDKLVVRVDSAFPPETKYILEVRGIRSAAGVAGDAKAVLAIPKRVAPTAADSAAVTDSTRTDSTRTDSTRVPKKPPKPTQP